MPSQLNLDDRSTPPADPLLYLQGKEKLITPEDFPRHFKGVYEGVAGKVYPLYQEELG